MLDDKITMSLIFAIVALLLIASVFVIVAADVGLDVTSVPLALSVVGFLGATIAGLLAGLLARLTHTNGRGEK